jgi:endonuclease/exonuclease/phosphatase family metal-dependent hydrolase
MTLLIAACGSSPNSAPGNTELNVVIPSGSSQSGPGAPTSFDIQVVEYTIACNDGIDFDPTTDPDIDSGPALDNDVTLNGVLEVLDSADPGVNTQDFGPDLGEVYVAQTYVDLPPTAGCTMQLRARDGDGEVICTATETFDILADNTTVVNVLMFCGISYQAPVGQLDGNGDFSFNIANYCPDAFVLNCIDSEIDIRTIPGIGEVAATACQVRFRDGDSQCGENCDPQDCVTDAEGLTCTPGPDPGVSTTVACAPAGFFCAIPGPPLFGTPCTPAPGDQCFDFSGGTACVPNAVIDCTGTGTPAASCTFSGDTLGGIGDPPPGPLAPGEGGFFVACVLADDDGDPTTPDVPVFPGATVTCTAVTTDGDVDCDKTKTVDVTCPGLTPCQTFGGDAACQAASASVCQAGTCNDTTCDGASAAACCTYAAVPDSPAVDCSSEIPEPTGECQAGVCVPTSCLDDASCDTDGNDCTWAPPGTCDLGTNLCAPLANRPSGFSCNGDTGTCDGGGTCIDNCTGVDCSDGNDCTQDLCDPSGGVATCSNPNEIDGTLCDSGVGPGSGVCQGGICIGPAAVRIETYNLALAGAFIPYEQERRQVLPQAVAAAESDILCLQEVWDETDKDAIRAAAMANFPYIIWFLDDLDTPLDDATDQNGQVPPAPTTVPCPDDVEFEPGISIADQMNTAIDCVRDGSDLQGNPCSTIPGSDEGRTTSTECAAEACLFEVAGLIAGTEQEQRCYACLATQLPTDTFGTIRGRCPTVINQELAFQGQNGVMILSRYPLSNAVNWVIPGTWNRRVILSATAELPNGTDLDVFCNHLTPIFSGITFPYTGQYGDGNLVAADAWEAEQFLQAEKLIAHVQNVSGSRPAVILGDLNAGRGYFDDPNNFIFPEGEPTLNLLEATFTPAYATDYVPACTFCQENPVAGVEREETVWIDHIHMYNVPATAVTATERTFDQNVLTVPDGAGGTMDIPLSDHYGMRSVIVVP